MECLYSYFVGVTYMLAMGVCGTVLVALGSTLGDLAKNFGGSDSSYYNNAYVYLNW